MAISGMGVRRHLTALAADFSTHTGSHVHRHIQAPLPQLTAEQELVLYRVAQEALTNTARHADATEVHLSLRGDADTVQLRVHDDGHGLRPGREGAGIPGMRERALLVGGDLTIGAATESGGTVECGLGTLADEASAISTTPITPKGSIRTIQV